MTAKSETEVLRETRGVERFIPCPVNGEAHPERIACEVQRSIDKRGKERFWFHCKFCNTRAFLNGWRPSMSNRTLVQVEAEGFYPAGVSAERRQQMLNNLGLKQVTPPAVSPGGWQQPVVVPFAGQQPRPGRPKR